MSDHDEPSVTNSKMSKRAHRTDLPSNRISTFQTLNFWDERLRKDPQSNFVSAVSLCVLVLQIVAIVYGPIFEYNAEVSRELAFFVQAFIFPLWDQRYGGVRLEFYFIPLAVVVAILCGFVGVFSGYVTKKLEQRRGPVDTIVLNVGLAFSSWAAMPATHLFMAVMACDNSPAAGSSFSAVVANFPETECFSPTHAIAIAVSTAGLALTFGVGALIAATLGNHDPQSNELLANAHSYSDLGTFTATFLLVVLRHILVPYGQSGPFSIIFIIVAVALLLSEATVLAPYHIVVTKIRCAGLSVAILVASVNAASAFAASWFVDSDINSFTLLALAPLAALLGWVAAEVRISPEFVFRFENLHMLALVHRHRGRFPYPKGLMSNELRFVKKRYRTIETDVITELEDMQGAPDADPEAAWERQISACSEILVPMVERVSLATDAEVAVRYLERHRRITALEPTGHILAFATRIYTKAMILFRRSGIVRYAFANFLFRYAAKLNIAMELIEEIEYEVGAQHDSVLLYSAFKLGVRVREIFGLRDNSLMRTFTRAKQLHRESLSLMTGFWSKLLDNRGDLVGLAHLANTITERRREAGLEYARALADRTDRLILTLYASFLENVLMNPVKAQEFREIADEIAEAKKNSMMRGSRKKNTIAPTLANLDLDSIEESSRGGGHGGGGEDGMGGAGGTTVHSRLRAINILLFVVVACSIVVFALQLYRSLDQMHDIELAAIGCSVKTSAERIAAKAFAAQRLRSECGAEACEDRTFISTLYSLSGEDVALRWQHNKFTHSAKRPASSSTRAYLQALTVGVPFTGTRALDGNLSTAPQFVTTPVSLTHPIGEYDAGRNRLFLFYNPWIVVHKLSTHASQFINAMVDGATALSVETTSAAASALIVIDDMSSGNVVTTALSNALVATRNEVEAKGSQTFSVIIAMFVIAVVVLFATYAVFHGHMRQLAIGKVATLSLFALIPYPTQEMLHSSAKSKIEQFEHLHTDDADGEGSSRGANDRDDENLLDSGGNNAGPLDGGRNDDARAAPREDDPAEIVVVRSLSPSANYNNSRSDEKRKASAFSDDARKRSSSASGGAPLMRLASAARSVVALGALHSGNVAVPSSPQGGGNAAGTSLLLSPSGANGGLNDFADDSVRKMSRFLGARPTLPGTSGHRQNATGPMRSILKKPEDIAAAAAAKKKRAAEVAEGGSAAKPRATFVKRVKFQIDDDGSRPHRKLKEPTIAVEMEEGELIADFTQSMKLAEDEERAFVEKQKLRHEQEMEKLIHGGMRGSQRGHRRHTSSSSLDAEKEDDERVTQRAFSLSNIVFAVTLVGLLAAVVLSAIASREQSRITSEAKKLLRRESTILNLKHHEQSMNTQALIFAHFGRVEAYQSFVSLLRSSRHRSIIDHLEYRPEEITPALSQAAVSATDGIDRVIGGDMIGLAYASRGMQDRVGIRDVPLVSTFQWRTNQFTSAVLNRYPSAYADPTSYIYPAFGALRAREPPAPNSSSTFNISIALTAAALQNPITAAELRALGLQRLHSTRAQSDKRSFIQVINNTIHAHTTEYHSQYIETFDLQYALNAAVVAVCVVAAVACVARVTSVVAVNKLDIRNVPVSQWAAFFGRALIADVMCHALVAILCIVAVAFAARACQIMNDLDGRDVAADLAELLNLHSATRSYIMDRRWLVSKYVTNASDLVAFEILEEHPSAMDLLMSLYEQCVQKRGLSLGGLTAAAVAAPLVKLERLQGIGMLLSYLASHNKESPPSTERFVVTTYDFTIEPGAAQDRIRYEQDNPHLQYTTLAADRATRSLAELQDMARFAVYGRRGADALIQVEGMLSTIGDSILHESQTKVDELTAEISASQIVVVVVVATALGTYCLLYGLPIVYGLLAGSAAGAAAIKRADTMMEALYTVTMRKVQMSLIFLALLLTGQFVITTFTSNLGVEGINIITTAFDRGYLVSRAAVSAERLVRTLESNNYARAVEVMRDMQDVSLRLSAARDMLYRSPKASSAAFGDVVSLSDEQKAVSFEGTNSLDRQYMDLVGKLASLAVSEIPIATEVAQGRRLAETDPAAFLQSTFIYPLTGNAIIDRNAKSTLLAAARDIIELAESVTARLKVSNDVHLEDVRDTMTRQRAPDIIFLIAVIVFAALEFRFVVRPVAHAAVTEDQGTKLMLRMIPQGVREMVPKIQVYLDSGLLVDEQTEKRAYDRSSTIESFVKKWQSGAPEEQCFSILRGHEHGVVVINSVGIVNFINDHVTKILGYEPQDMLRQNVKMIVDEPLRSLHDGFLRRFIQQGTSRVVGGGRDVLALSKSGGHVHVFLHLYEAVRHTGEIFFVGEIRRYDWMVAMGASVKSQQLHRRRKFAQDEGASSATHVADE